MYKLDAIESINFEQLATATDRLLLRGRPSKWRSAQINAHRIPSPRTPEIRPTMAQSRVVRVAVLASLFSLTAMVVALF